MADIKLKEPINLSIVAIEIEPNLPSFRCAIELSLNIGISTTTLFLRCWFLCSEFLLFKEKLVELNSKESLADLAELTDLNKAFVLLFKKVSGGILFSIKYNKKNSLKSEYSFSYTTRIDKDEFLIISNAFNDFGEFCLHE